MFPLLFDFVPKSYPLPIKKSPQALIFQDLRGFYFSLKLNMNYAKVKGEELFLELKTSKAERCISIPDFLYEDIQKYVSKLYGIEKGDRIFYFTKSALDKEIKRIAPKVGLPIIKVHDLRHSHASMLIEMGFAPLENCGPAQPVPEIGVSGRRIFLNFLPICAIL